MAFKFGDLVKNIKTGRVGRIIEVCDEGCVSDFLCETIGTKNVELFDANEYDLEAVAHLPPLHVSSYELLHVIEQIQTILGAPDTPLKDQVLKNICKGAIRKAHGE